MRFLSAFLLVILLFAAPYLSPPRVSCKADFLHPRHYAPLGPLVPAAEPRNLTALAKAAATIPTFDWRTQPGILPPVGNQGQSNGCWSFASTHAAFAAANIARQKSGQPLFTASQGFSQQQLVDCAPRHAFGVLGLFVKDGTGPNLPSNAFEYLIDHQAIFASDYPYEYERGDCRDDSQPGSGIQLSGQVEPEGQGHGITSNEDENWQNLMELVKKGPVATILHADDNLYDYRGGILQACGAGFVNHVVLIVGFGEENGIKYWIVRNSWGAGWGEQGHFRIEMGRSLCGIGWRNNAPTVNA